MDNISHSMAGLLAGELIHRSLPDESTPESNRIRRRLLLVCSAVASNFPDLDLVLTPLLPQPLGYLLHHRGHTHTILYALPQALLLFAVVWLTWRSARELLKASRAARKGLSFALVIGFSLHLLMDYLNSYGLHPFHPFDSNWIFGDMVFIVEPFFWICFGMPMAMMVERRRRRFLAIGFLLGLPVLFTSIGFLSWMSLAVLGLTALGLAWGQSRAGARQTGNLVLAAMLGFIFVAVQSFASGLAKRAVRDYLAMVEPTNDFLDSSMSSYPTNPFCWGFLSIESNEHQGQYHLQRGLVSLAPGLVPLKSCPTLPAGRSAPDLSQTNAATPIALFSKDSGELAHLRQLAAENCHFEAWMRFARIPLLKSDRAEDLRFQNGGPRGNFTVLELSEFKDRACSRLIPQWGFPRADLLNLKEKAQ